MILGRIHKGAKEIDFSVTLQRIRDQRANMVRTKAQFEFSFFAVAREVSHGRHANH
jgi:receptor-type tyrosine-protein phosphatase N